jgi:hypothetical protein
MTIRSYRILILSIIALGSANSADWKYLGPNSIRGKKYEAFYDEHTTVKKSDGSVSLWVKLISREELDGIYSKHTDSLMHLAAKKIAFYYIPSFMMAQSDTSDFAGRCIDVTLLEVTANNFGPKDKMKIQYALDCQQNKCKVTSSIVYNKRGESIGKPVKDTEWSDAAPETFAEWMIKIVCTNFP